MKIVELVNNLDVGGTEKLVVDLATTLQARGHQLAVVCLREKGALAPVLERIGIEVKALNKPEGPAFKTLFELVAYLRSHRFDVIHTHNPLVHHYGVIGGRLAGVPVIVNTIHGLGNLADRPGMKELLYSLMCRFSDRIVAVGKMAFDSFKAGGVIPRDKLVAIVNGIPLESFTKAQCRGSKAEFVFGIVGRLVPVKDHRSLLEAFSKVIQEFPQCRLEVLGDGPLRVELQDLANQLSITDRVLFHGFSADVAGFLERVDVSVLCSVSEGLPLSVLEAMAASRPIIGTAVGGIPDLVNLGRCGWICAPGNPDQLATAMKRAVSASAAERAEMGHRGQEYAVQHYSLSRMTEEYELLFDQILKET